MYSIASSMSGVPVETSLSLRQDAEKAISSSSRYGASLYTQSAADLYNSGYYAPALYDAEYASVFDNPIIDNYTPSQMLNKTRSDISNSTYGIWPNQFALSSLFYLNEWNITDNQSYLQEAYTMSALALSLSNSNKIINSTFIAVPYNQTIAPNALAAINQKIEQLYILMFVIVVILFMILIILLLMLLGEKRYKK